MFGENFKNDDLIILSKVIYARRYYLSLNSDIQELSEFINCSSSEVESSIQFVKRIEQKIHQENESA